MEKVKTVLTKNGQTYYYLDGKRISAKAAQEIMNAPATPATPATLAIVRDGRSDALFAEQAKNTQHRRKILSTGEKYSAQAKQAKRVTRAKNSLNAFVQAALITLLLLILAITGFDFSASQAINAINVYLIICVLTFLIIFKHYQDTKDDALVNKI